MSVGPSSTRLYKEACGGERLVPSGGVPPSLKEGDPHLAELVDRAQESFLRRVRLARFQSIN